jgi:Fe-S cluster biogenesis protein NfuA/nitrite reductase/ring-hydroxylating ferredoxin subunit
MTSVQQVSARVEELLGTLKSGGFGSAAPAAEELVGLLVDLYGDGLSQIVTILADAGPDGAAMLSKLAEDPLVEGLLLLHDLHPLGTDARIQRALDGVRPYLGSHAGGVQYLGVTDGVARLRLEGSCHGCPSSTVTVQLAITGAVRDAAPEVTDVVVEGMTTPPEPALLQIGRRPDALPGDQTHIQNGNAVTWVPLPDVGPPSSRPVAASAGGIPVLLCAVRGTLYAYRDRCPRCGASMADGSLDREILACPGCGAQFNVRLAGKCADSTAAGTGAAGTGAAGTGAADTGAGGAGGLHLDPLPLLADSHGVRVAVPEEVLA